MAIVTAGCGGKSDEEQIAEVFEQIGADASALCDLGTSEYVLGEFGGKQKCLADQGDDRKRAVEVRATEVNSGRARARVHFAGEGEATFVLVKEDDEWRIARSD